jgi:hypothetical protein
MATHRVISGLIAGTTIAGLAACGGGTSATVGSFNDQGNRVLSCMAHQSAAPATSYHPGTAEDPSHVLTYLHYYTVNGNKPYCDGHPATAIDRQWLDLYLAGGATRSNVAGALGSGS